MKIWFDVDGVLANFNKNVVQVANDCVRPEDKPLSIEYVPQDWSYSDVFSKEEWNKIWEKIKTIPDFWLRADAISKNVLPLRYWMVESQHEIFFITSRMPTGGVDAKAQTQLWLHNQGLYSTNRPSTVIAVQNPEEKKRIVQQYEIDLGIDDYAPTVEAMNALPDHSCYLLSQPWNRESNQPRVGTLKEFLDMVDSASHWTTA